MKKSIPVLIFLAIITVVLVLLPSSAMADESNVTYDVNVNEYLEEANCSLLILDGFTINATVSSSCISTGTINWTNGIIVIDKWGAGFFESDFNMTIDGKTYSGDMKGHNHFYLSPLGFEMWGEFQDNNPNNLKGRYHVMLDIDALGPPLVYTITTATMEITWKDGNQCYCMLDMNVQDSTYDERIDVVTEAEKISFIFDGDSAAVGSYPGAYTGTFDGTGIAVIYENAPGTVWNNKGYVHLNYALQGYPNNQGEMWSYAFMEFYQPGPPILKELSYIGAIFETIPTALDGSVDNGLLSFNIIDPFTPVGTGSGSFRIYHIDSDPCPTPTPTPTPSPTPEPTATPEPTITPEPTATPDDGGGEGCFIATASSGDPDNDGRVQTLRDFRDDCLLSNGIGSDLVSTYYSISPPVAEFIDNNPALKPIVRGGLIPAVAVSTSALNITLPAKIAIVSLIMIFTVALIACLRKVSVKENV